MTKRHPNDIFIDAGFSRFQLFYIEAIMNDSSFPMVNRVKTIFENLSLDEFLGFVEKVFSVDDYEVSHQFFYFLILFRDMKHIQDHMNSERFSFEMLEKFIIFTFGYCGMHDNSTENIMDDVLSFFNNEKLYELAMKSDYVKNDKLLFFLMISKFDAGMLDRFFSETSDKSAIINYFLKLPENVLRGIISRNYHLFQHFMLMLSEADSTRHVSSDFIEKYQSDIRLFSRLNDLILRYRETVDFEKERGLPFSLRNMSRLHSLVSMVKEMPDPVKAIEYFSGEQVFIDEMEKKIVHSVVTDPTMKNIFSRYDMQMKE